MLRFVSFLFTHIPPSTHAASPYILRTSYILVFRRKTKAMQAPYIRHTSSCGYLIRLKKIRKTKPKRRLILSAAASCTNIHIFQLPTKSNALMRPTDKNRQPLLFLFFSQAQGLPKEISQKPSSWDARVRCNLRIRIFKPN